MAEELRTTLVISHYGPFAVSPNAGFDNATADFRACRDRACMACGHRSPATSVRLQIATPPQHPTKCQRS